MEEVKYEKLAQKDDDTEEKDEETNITINHDDNTNHNDDEDDGEDDDNAAQTDKIRKEDIKFKITGLTNKKILLRELYDERSEGKPQIKRISKFQVLLSGIVVRSKNIYLSSKDESQSWGLWKGHLKTIGGRFGNGVLSFFTLLRWLLYLNCGMGLIILAFITIPALSFNPVLCKDRNISERLVFTTNHSQSNHTLQHYSIKSCEARALSNLTRYRYHPDGLQNLIDFFQGTGWLNMTVLFYARYENVFLYTFGGWIYNFSLAYLLTSISNLLLSLFLIVSTAIQIFEEGYIKGGVSNTFSLSNMIFGSWDMCIMSEETANLTSASIAQEIEAAVEETKRQSRKEQRTKKEKYCLRFTRVLVNLIIILMLSAGGFAIYQATRWSMEQANSGKSKQNFRTMIINYISPITITVVNAMLPAVFYKLSEFEDFNPRVKVNWDLGRTVLVKLASICVLVVTIFRRTKDKETKVWENFMAAEMYKLVWMGFFTSLFVTLIVEFPRGYIGRNVDAGCKLNEKVGIPEFHIPTNVLDLIYGQTIIWIGAIYSPLLPLMQCVNLFLLFYIKKISLLKNFDPPKKPYRAGKSNYFFMILQLISLALSMVATTYAITQITPSANHGPFSGFKRMYDIIILTINDLPAVYKYIIGVIFSPCVIVLVFIVLCLCLYFYKSMYHVYSKSANTLKIQLKSEQKEKKTLLQNLRRIDAKQVSIDEDKEDAMTRKEDKEVQCDDILNSDENPDELPNEDDVDALK